MDQILQRGCSAPAPHNRAFSSALNQTQNNLLVRKDETPLTSGIQVTSATLVSAPQSRRCLRKKIKSFIDVTVFSPPCRTNVRTLTFGQRWGIARRSFRATVTWQLQVTLEPNWAATRKPMALLTRAIWRICWGASLIASNCCHAITWPWGGVIKHSICSVNEKWEAGTKTSDWIYVDHSCWQWQWIPICKTQYDIIMYWCNTK